jgi:hypothetical protein
MLRVSSGGQTVHLRQNRRPGVSSANGSGGFAGLILFQGRLIGDDILGERMAWTHAPPLCLY